MGIYSELCTQQHLRANVFSPTGFMIIALCLYSVWLLYLDTLKICHIFFLFLLVHYIVELYLSRSQKIVACPTQAIFQRKSSKVGVRAC